MMYSYMYNDGPYKLIVLHFLLGIAYYMECEGELSFCLDMCSWIVVAYSSLCCGSYYYFLDLSNQSRKFFLDGMSL
ncbi:hypothetical protein NC653_012677 [Populus alba x Populus x berolinensis]|uniref:Uncharacterized protein n=1 Tax=Populus alba x Populus x berolinensis TaxID=444605 RepID=A0AAD6QSU7_9ROSI|nr:hypothetical protein NC653_012677 [Populus alba x Populus x berolinensis]